MTGLGRALRERARFETENAGNVHGRRVLQERREIICIRRSPVRFITDYCPDTSNTVNFTRKTTRRLRAPMQLPLHSYPVSLSRCSETSTQDALFICKQFRSLGFWFSLRATLPVYRNMCQSRPGQDVVSVLLLFVRGGTSRATMPNAISATYKGAETKGWLLGSRIEHWIYFFPSVSHIPAGGGNHAAFTPHVAYSSWHSFVQFSIEMEVLSRMMSGFSRFGLIRGDLFTI